MSMNNCPKIAAYYFPNYHADVQNHIVHGDGWDEWDLVKQARPRFHDHYQPRVPLWGYQDESDPKVMRQKIECAANYGVDAFIFDWYWHENGPFLERALLDGFLPAARDAKLQFSLMWANHDWLDLHPWTCDTPKKLLYHGMLSDAGFEQMTDFIIDKLFSHPAYLKIDGKPYFSIYEYGKIGGLERLERFREKTIQAGFPGLHLNLIVQKVAILPGENGTVDLDEIQNSGLFDSLTSYIWLHQIEANRFPMDSYDRIMREYFNDYAKIEKRCSLPFYPNVTVGWDSSPRTDQSTAFEASGYPYSACLNSTPELFGQALQRAGKFRSQLITINAWNEWTEGSYLEPDEKFRYGYLEQIRKFKDLTDTDRPFVTQPFSNFDEGHIKSTKHKQQICNCPNR